MTNLETQTVGAPPGKPPGLVGTDDFPPERPRRRRWIALLLVSLLFVGGAAYGAMRFFAAADDDAIAYVPRDAFLYTSVFLEASTSQRRALRDLLERTPMGSPEAAESAITDLLDRWLAQYDLDFENDVSPWMGDQIALFGLVPPGGIEAMDDGELDVGLLIAVEDEDAAREAIETGSSADETETRTYKGYDYQIDPRGIATGFVGSFAFGGTRRGLEEVVDAYEGDRSLQTSARYQRTIDGLETDRLGLFYLDEGALWDASLQQASPVEADMVRRLGLMSGGAQAAVVYAEPSAIVIEAASQLPKSGLLRETAVLYGDLGIMARLPANAWAVLNLPSIGPALRGAVDVFSQAVPGGADLLTGQIRREFGLDIERDVLSWMGDAGLFAVGGAGVGRLGGAMVFASTDAEASEAAVHRIAGLMIAAKVPVEPRKWQGEGGGPHPGYAVDLGGPELGYLVAADDEVVFAYGELAIRSTLSAANTMGNDRVWDEIKSRLGTGYVPVAYVELETARSLVEASGVGALPAYKERVKPWLEPLSHLFVGAKREGSRVWTRMVIGVE